MEDPRTRFNIAMKSLVLVKKATLIVCAIAMCYAEPLKTRMLLMPLGEGSKGPALIGELACCSHDSLYVTGASHSEAHPVRNFPARNKRITCT